MTGSRSLVLLNRLETLGKGVRWLGRPGGSGTNGLGPSPLRHERPVAGTPRSFFPKPSGDKVSSAALKRGLLCVHSTRFLVLLFYLLPACPSTWGANVEPKQLENQIHFNFKNILDSTKNSQFFNEKSQFLTTNCKFSTKNDQKNDNIVCKRHQFKTTNNEFLFRNRQFWGKNHQCLIRNQEFSPKNDQFFIRNHKRFLAQYHSIIIKLKFLVSFRTRHSQEFMESTLPNHLSQPPNDQTIRWPSTINYRPFLISFNFF